MLTLFTLPKPFAGEAATLQQTALASWARLGASVQVVLIGGEAGIAAAATAAGVEHIGEVDRSPRGTPRLDDAFARVDEIARYPLRLFVNSDVVLLPDILEAAGTVAGTHPFLLVGQTREIAVSRGDITEPTMLRRRALSEGRLRGAVAIDWFVFPAGLFDPMPPFLVGRASFDNWLVWRARQVGPVIDATRDVVAIHQPHDYGHLPGGLNEAYYGEEAQENLRLGGGTRRRFTLLDASHRLDGGRVRRNPAAILRVGDTLRRVRYKLARGR